MLQIWLMFAIHPLMIVIVPAALAAYLAIQKEKRLKAQYGIGDEKVKTVFHPYSLMPQREWKSFESGAGESSEDHEKENSNREEN